jgi:polysaccharide pyruvyl transferase WcaK-like protein
MVSGGGQLDEFWGGPWGHPYAMFKWTFAARLTGTRVVFLSVGAGTLSNPTTRGLVRKALRAAFYKSFRDPRTVKTVESLHVGGKLNLVPDLAFSHPAGRAPEAARPSGKARVIALSPIVYKDPASWPEKDAAFYSAYLDELATLAQLLLARGDAVRVLTSDHSDNSAARELFARIQKRLPNGIRAELLLPETTEEFLSQMQASDLLVASRLHGVILAQIVATPVVAISYNWKVDEQMRHSGCAHYNASIEAFDAPQVLGLIDAALAERDALSARLAARAAESYSLLDRQYSEVFGFLTPAR